MNIDLNERVVVITGSSRGLGKNMARKFASEGARVVINYHKNEKDAKNLLSEIQDKFNNMSCVAFRADVTNEKDVLSLYHFVMEKYGRVDVLINNAGKISDNYLHFMSNEQWNDVISTNLTSAYLCSRIFSKNMIYNKSGKIINISSLKGQRGSEGQCNYAASKAGLIGFTKSLAKEIGPFGISVNAVCPGFIVTDLNRDNLLKSEIASNMSVLNTCNSLEDFLDFMVVMSSSYFTGISGQVFNLDSRIK